MKTFNLENMNGVIPAMITSFNKDESSGSGSYGTVEFVAVFGSNPF